MERSQEKGSKEIRSRQEKGPVKDLTSEDDALLSEHAGHSGT